MGAELGIILAFVAMLCWGFGDFLIQKFSRKIGDWETLLAISFVGAIILLPFVYGNLKELFLTNHGGLVVLIIASFLLLLAALLDFEALKRSKISVAEPIFSLEIPFSSFLAFFIINEVIKIEQIILIVLLVAGILMVSLKSYHLTKKVWLEKGVFIAVFGAIIMALVNFLFGVGARLTDALLINWFTSLFLMISCIAYLTYKKRLGKFYRDCRRDKKSLLAMCLLDNCAWIAFAFSMMLAPIAISVSISQSYIIITVLLGMLVNKESLRRHQRAGLFLVIVSAIILAYISG